MWAAFSKTFPEAAGFIKKVFGTVFGVVKMQINTLISIVNTVTSSINKALSKVKIPDWVPVFGGKSFSVNIPKIPQLAEGGIATRSTIANIGEGGEPEAVLPLSKLSSMLGGASGGNISVSFSPTINVSGGGDVYAEVRRGLDAARVDLERSLERLLANNRRLSFA